MASILLPRLTIIIGLLLAAAKEILSCNAHSREPGTHPWKQSITTLDGSSENDVVRVFRFSNEAVTKIICMSSHHIKWVLGSDSNQFPSTELLHSEPFRQCERKVFCLSLEILYWSPLWHHSTLYAKCETNATSTGRSRWYKLVLHQGKQIFESQDVAFSPKITSDLKKLRERSNSTSESSADRTVCVQLTILIGAGGGAAGFFVLLLIFMVLLCKKVKRQHKQIEIASDEIDEFTLGVAREKAQAKGINGLFVLPYDTKLEIPKSDVLFRSTVLGSGAFGQVVKGAYHGNEVAIKMVKSNAKNNADHLKSLLGELKVMSYLGHHPNLVGLIGAITANIKNGQVYLIFEYCSNGNAHKFVQGHRDDFKNMLVVEAPSYTSRMKKITRLSKIYGAARRGTSLTTKDLVRWAYEAASGMEYVATRNVYHGDLAARNILLTEDLTAKVGDFGLSKQVDVEKYNCYVQKKECPLPLKWMAIESLRDLTFSIRSDVWSYGVTLWELFTLGTTPYPGMHWNFESWKLLCEGKRLEKPEYASDSIYNIMMSCWNADPKARPAFDQLRKLLQLELEKL